MTSCNNLIIVLVCPQGAINIGAICRIIMNFGFEQLRLVSPCKDYQSMQAKKMALKASNILESAQVFDNLSSALQDIHIAYGTTRRFGKYRKDFYTPAKAAEIINQNIKKNIKSALVMGQEDRGLQNKDLDLCQRLITIPTHENYPSMNLSHALCILLYELSLKSNFNDKLTKQTQHPATGQEIESMFNHMRNTLLSIDYLDTQNPDHLLRTFRRIFGNAGLSTRDVSVIRGLMSRIDWTEKQRRRLMQPKL